MNDRAAIPVVCIHGALRSRVGMWPTAWYLRRLGLDARAFGYTTRRGTLQSRAAALDAFVSQWLRDRDRDRASDRAEPEPEPAPEPAPEPVPVLGFLTHSMGGLVVRAWLASGHARPEQRQRIVMLSPPNRGSQLARQNATSPWFRIAYGDAAHELASDVALGLGPAPASADVLVLAGGSGSTRGFNPRLEGDDDGVVAVAEMGMPGVDPTFVGGVHSFLQWTPALLRRAAAFIRTGVDPGNADADVVRP